MWSRAVDDVAVLLAVWWAGVCIALQTRARTLSLKDLNFDLRVDSIDTYSNTSLHDIERLEQKAMTEKHS